MTWTIRVSKKADKAIAALDRPTAKWVIGELEAISHLDDPHSRGKALTANLTGLWRYRVGDYRIVCDIEDGELIVLVLDVAHRSKAYKRP